MGIFIDVANLNKKTGKPILEILNNKIESIGGYSFDTYQASIFSTDSENRVLYEDVVFQKFDAHQSYLDAKGW